MKRRVRPGDAGEVRGWWDRWRATRRQAKRRRDRDRERCRTARPRRERFSDWDEISRYADPFE